MRVIDQTRLPRVLEWVELRHAAEFCRAIADMQVRGAPLIGITAAYGLALALQEDAGRDHLADVAGRLAATRPTAVNLQWALRRVERAALREAEPARAAAALAEASAIAAEDVANCRAIGEHGLALLREIAAAKPGEQVNILTHCNAGALATLQWGTALSPIYLAREQGLPVHVWVSETRPRNQGTGLTAWELERAGIAHTVIADNAAGLLMQQGRVDCCLVGSDRTVANGDVCNKVGTYLKALAAAAHAVPFYVALPVSTIDLDCARGESIPIEERSAAEVLSVEGRSDSGESVRVHLGSPATRAFNPAFDVTPAALVSALITERGVIPATKEALAALGLESAGAG